MRAKPETGLNLAVVNFLLQCAATRSLESMAGLGLENHEIRDLMELTGEDMARLSMCEDRIFKISVDRPALRRVMRNVLTHRCALRNALIRANAPRAMIERWWPMRHKEFRDLRTALTAGTDIQLSSKGRPKSATEAEEMLLWESWADLTLEKKIRDLGPQHYLDLHLATGICLSMVWRLTNTWASEGHYGNAKQRVAR